MYFKTFQINDHIYQFKDPLGVLCTLIIGKEKAMLIDTCYGIGDLPSLIKNYTNLPLVVIASHGHMDHTGGNYQFEEVYINELDLELCKQYNSYEWRKSELANAINANVLPTNFDEKLFLSKRAGNLKVIKNYTTIDLGNINCEIIPMEGHTQGSIGIYIKEENILVVTDATCPFVWMFLPESTTVQTYIDMLNRTLKLPFKYILLGHGAGTLVSRKRVLEFLNVASTINMKIAKKVTFNNFEKYNSYCYTLGKMYDQNDCGIVFDPNKLYNK